MKLGIEDRKKVIGAGALFAFAVFLLWRTFGSSGPAIAAKPPAPAEVTNAAAAARTTRRSSGHGRARGTNAATPAATPVTASLDPRIRLDLLKASESTEYKGSGRNIFRAEEEIKIPQPEGNGLTGKAKTPPPPVPQPNPGPPPPPPIPYKFFGFASRPGEPKKVFLSQGDDVFIAGEGEVVGRRYKIVKINANSVEIEDLLANNKQTIPLSAS